jgi:hypothetical protein
MIGYRCLNRLNKFVKAQKYKDITTVTNNEVYKIKCNDCDASYIGQTKRKLNTRIKVHTNNIKLDSSKHSVISEHITHYNHSIDSNNTLILDREPKYYKRLISEMIHIKEQNNGLNLRKDTELLNESYFDFLDRLVGRD